MNWTLPAWKLPDVKIKDLKFVRCVDPLYCGDIPSASSLLLSDYDGTSNLLGKKFTFTCNLDKTGKTFTYFNLNDNAHV